MHDHTLSDLDRREALGVHQLVGVGPGNTEHRGHLIRSQRQRKLNAFERNREKTPTPWMTAGEREWLY